jgi:hypothetical protein
LTSGAEILLRTLSDDPRQPIATADRDALAGHLGKKPSEEKAEVAAAVDRYSDRLASLGLDDARLLSGLTGGRFVWRSIGLLLLALVLLPFALVGAAINWIPFLLVKGVGLLRVAPAVHSTIKPVSAILFFGIAWGLTLWAAFQEWGARGSLLTLMLLPLYLGAVIVFLETVQTLWGSLQTWRHLRRVRSSEDVIESARQEVLDVLVEAL